MKGANATTLDCTAGRGAEKMHGAPPSFVALDTAKQSGVAFAVGADEDAVGQVDDTRGLHGDRLVLVVRIVTMFICAARGMALTRGKDVLEGRKDVSTQ